MTKLLAIAANPDAPVACDLTGSEDTLAERMAEWRRLFEHALLDRDSSESATTFRLAARPGVQEWVLDLVRREAACCPFLSYDVNREDDVLEWMMSGLGRPDMAVVDEVVAGSCRTAPPRPGRVSGPA